MRSRKSQSPAAQAHTLPPPAERMEAAEVNSDQAKKEKGYSGRIALSPKRQITYLPFWREFGKQGVYPMRDRDKEYDEFLDVWNKSKGNRPTQRQSVPQARATTRTGR